MIKKLEIMITCLVWCVFVVLYSACCYAAPDGIKTQNRMEIKIDETQRETLLEGTTARGQVILWAGLDRDSSPWIDVLMPQKNIIQTLSFKDNRYNIEVRPTSGNVDYKGQKLVFMSNWSLGIYDFLKAKGFLLKQVSSLEAEDDFLTNPQWFSDREIMVLSYQGWGTLELFDVETSSSRIAFSSPTMFIADYDIGPSGLLVAAMGPAHKQLRRGRLAPNVYSIDETRADRINLYFIKPGKTATDQITKGDSYDFAPKVSPNGQYVAFLRGKKKIRKALNEDREYSLSDTNPALYVYASRTKKVEQIEQNSLLKTSFDFLWKDGDSLLFIRPERRGTALFSYEIPSRRCTRLYSTDNSIVSFLWVESRRELFLIERKEGRNDYLIICQSGCYSKNGNL